MNPPPSDHPSQQHHLLTEQRWSQGWEGHELDQLRRTAALPLLAKVQWLEQAQKLSAALERARLEAGGPPSIR